MEHMVWIWLAVTFLAVVCEIMTAELVSIWFVPGAIAGIVLAVLEQPVWIQAIVFFASSVVLVVLFQILFISKKKKGKKNATNLDIIIGEKAVVTETINNISFEGCVKINGQYWSARSEDDSVINKDEIVEIVAVSGVKLICKKI